MGTASVGGREGQSGTLQRSASVVVGTGWGAAGARRCTWPWFPFILALVGLSSLHGEGSNDCRERLLRDQLGLRLPDFCGFPRTSLPNLSVSSDIRVWRCTPVCVDIIMTYMMVTGPVSSAILGRVSEVTRGLSSPWDLPRLLPCGGVHIFLPGLSKRKRSSLFSGLLRGECLR